MLQNFPYASNSFHFLWFFPKKIIPLSSYSFERGKKIALLPIGEKFNSCVFLKGRIFQHEDWLLRKNGLKIFRQEWVCAIFSKGKWHIRQVTIFYGPCWFLGIFHSKPIGPCRFSFLLFHEIQQHPKQLLILADFKKKYNVFLRFRIIGSHNTFIDHLYAHMILKGIFAFMDDIKIEQGKPISSQFVEVVRDSRVSIVVFLKDYAASTWCLDEMATITDC